MTFPSFLSWRIVLVGILGIPQGTVFVLLLSSTQVWLNDAGISKTTIGLFALASLPHALKFLWAPLIDHTELPFFSKVLGRRRSWAVLAQCGLIISLILLGMTDPKTDFSEMVLFLVCVSFFAATQEIVLDAYRIEIIPPREKGYAYGVTSYVLGYRLGTILGGAGALYIASFYGWFWVYAVTTLWIALPSFILLFGPDPKPIETDLMKERQKKALSFLKHHKNLHGRRARILAWLYGAVVGPFSEFTKRQDWLLIFFLILCLKLGDSLIQNMANIFYLDTGYTKIEIANVTKFFGVIATIFGGIIGGMISSRLGLIRGLLVCGVVHALSNMMFIVQSNYGAEIALLYFSIAVENVTGGMNTAAFIAYLSSLCHKSFTGTQYALLSAIWYLSTNLGAIGGYIADNVSWQTYFIFAVAMALPGLAILSILHKRNLQRRVMEMGEINLKKAAKL